MSIFDVVVSIVVGLVFGFVLQRCGLGQYSTISNQFRFADNTMMKFMLSAIAVGAVGTLACRAAGLVDLAAMPEGFLVASLLGGAVFGVGMALAGTCPGTIFAGMGQGSLDYLVAGVLGFLAGGLVLGLGFEQVVMPLRAMLSLGSASLTDLAGVPSFVGVIVVVAGVIAFYLVSRHMGRRS